MQTVIVPSTAQEINMTVRILTEAERRLAMSDAEVAAQRARWAQVHIAGDRGITFKSRTSKEYNRG